MNWMNNLLSGPMIGISLVGKKQTVRIINQIPGL